MSLSRGRCPEEQQDRYLRQAPKTPSTATSIKRDSILLLYCQAICVLITYHADLLPIYITCSCQSTLYHRLSPVCTAASRSITSLQKNSKGQRTFNAHNPGRSTRSTLRRPGSSHSTPPTPSAATLFGRLLHMIMGEQDTLRNVTTLEFMS